MPIVRVEMLTGRTPEQKRELAAALSEATSRIAKCPISDVQVIISEIERTHWAVAGVMMDAKAQPKRE